MYERAVQGMNLKEQKANIQAVEEQTLLSSSFGAGRGADPS
jgi:hypothetical protein